MDMETDDKELDIVIDDDKKSTADVEIAIEPEETASAEPAAKLPTPEEGIEELRRSLESERARRLDAERQAREAQSEIHRARSEVDDTNLQLVTNAIAQRKAEAANLKAGYKAALQGQDFDMAADIQEAMATNAAQLLQLENGKTQMEAQPKRQEPRGDDPVEAFVSQLSAPAARWVRAHPECVTNPRMNQKMIAAHNLAMADGIEADSAEYFTFIEGTINARARAPEAVRAVEPVSTAAEPVQRRAAPPAAPVSRSGTANGVPANVVRLSAEEREMATLMGMTPQEYAKGKIHYQKAGKIN